jgi:hypothetical protein
VTTGLSLVNILRPPSPSTKIMIKVLPPDRIPVADPNQLGDRCSTRYRDLMTHGYVVQSRWKLNDPPDMDMALDSIVPESLDWRHIDEGPECVSIMLFV